jgi:biopolymer transport protein ExbD
MADSTPRTAITPTRADDFPEWYQQVVRAADLAENSDVRGCMLESKTATQVENPTDPIVLAITADEKIVLQDRPLNSVDELTSALQEVQKKAPDRPLAMKADQKVSFGFLVQVLDSLKKAGVKNLPTFTKAPDQK